MLVNASAPISLPCREIEIDPVAARFARVIELKVAKSTDQACVILPSMLPLVKTTLRVAWKCAFTDVHLIVDSEVHAVARHTLCPNLTVLLKDNLPNASPCTFVDELESPLGLKLPRDKEEMMLASYETTPVSKAMFAPIVIVACKVLPGGLWDLHAKDESEYHAVASLAVIPT